jgi:hypothetical protein
MGNGVKSEVAKRVSSHIPNPKSHIRAFLSQLRAGHFTSPISHRTSRLFSPASGRCNAYPHNAQSLRLFLLLHLLLPDHLRMIPQRVA